MTAASTATSSSAFVDRVREERTTYVVERGGTPVAQIAPVDTRSFTLGDLKAILGSLPGTDAEYHAAVERAVARHNRPRVRRNPWER